MNTIWKTAAVVLLAASTMSSHKGGGGKFVGLVDRLSSAIEQNRAVVVPLEDGMTIKLEPRIPKAPQIAPFRILINDSINIHNGKKWVAVGSAEISKRVEMYCTALAAVGGVAQECIIIEVDKQTQADALSDFLNLLARGPTNRNPHLPRLKQVCISWHQDRAEPGRFPVHPAAPK